MNSRDLNSINEAFVQATTKVVAEKTAESEKNVSEIAGAAIRGTGAVVGGALKGVGAVARGAGKAVAGSTKWAGDKLDDRRDRKKVQKAIDNAAKKKAKREESSKEPKTEDIGPDFGDEEDFGDPSRHSGDYLDSEPLDVGDIVEVEGEDDDFVVLGIDGEWVQAAAVGDGIEVKRDSVVKADGARDHVPPHDEDKLDRAKQRGYESVKIERRLVTLKEKKKIMKFTNIMAEYESRLSSSSRGFSLKSKLNEEDGESFKQPDESVGVKVDKKSQRPTDETSGTDQESSTENVDDDLQDPKEEEEKNTKKEKKVVEDSINNSNKGNIMSQDKSIFDKLYEQVMGEDDEFELGLPGDDDLGGDGLGDELGDELGGEEITVTLTPDQVDALKAVVDQFPAPEDELGGEDEFGGDEEVPDESFRRESADTVAEGDETSTGKPTSDGTKPGVDPSDGGGKTTDPASDSLGGKSSGTGQAKVTDDDPSTGKETGDGKKPGVAKNSGKPGKLKANAKI